jgi:ATP/maltotriose-dependent transcriptional regulator MalT
MTYGGDGGQRPTDEVKATISRRLKEKYASGWIHPMKGKHHSEETKQKLRDALLGKMTGENNPMFGHSYTEETRQKMSIAHSGEKNAFFGKKHTEESREKIRASKQNISAETRQKISEAHKGIALSNESKAKMIATKEANTDIRHAPIIELFNAGIQRQEIAQLLNVSYAVVKQALLRHKKRLT